MQLVEQHLSPCVWTSGSSWLALARPGSVETPELGARRLEITSLAHQTAQPEDALPTPSNSALQRERSRDQGLLIGWY